MKFKSQLLTGAAVFAIIGTIAPQIGCSSSDSSTAAVADPTITSFVAAKTTVTVGDSTTLTAVFADGTATIKAGTTVVAASVTSGTAVSITAALGATEYTLTVTNTAGVAKTSTVTVTGVAAPSITSFTSDVTSVVEGGAVVLSPVFADGTGAIDNSVGAVESGSTYTVNPTAATTYTLTVTNLAGTAVTATVAVDIVTGSTDYTTDISSTSGVTITASDNSGDDTSLAYIASADVDPTSSSDGSTTTCYWNWPSIVESTIDYVFPSAATFAYSGVYWWQDGTDETAAGTRAPKSYKIQYLDTDGTTYTDVASPASFTLTGGAWFADSANAAYYTAYDQYDYVGFTPVTTTGIRLVMEPRDQVATYALCLGLQRWKVFGTIGATASKK